MTPFADPATALRWVTSIASVGILISSLEAISMRALFRDNGLFGWPTLRTRWAWTAGDGPAARVLSRFLAYPNVLYVLGVRAAAAGLLIVGVDGMWSQLGITIVFLSNALILGARPAHNTGADAMARIIFAALFLAQVVANSPLAAKACLLFIALQACLAYCGNGLYKARNRTWREGSAIYEITQNEVYGYPPAARFLRRHALPGKLLTWGTVSMECLFPLVLVVGYPACWVFLAWGVVFHLLNTFFAGLNSFFWVFVATYPAILFAVNVVAGLIYG